MKEYIISPSILGIKEDILLDKINQIEMYGAKYLHFDVMDGKFVPNTSFSLETLKWISDKHHLVNDVHIMIENPLKYAKDYIDNGANILTFHYEACKDDNEVEEVIKLIKKYNCKVGVSIKPNTKVEVMEKFLNHIDLVLVMSVEPGFGGQSFMPIALDKIKYLRNYIDNHHLSTLIEVDGGINKETALLVKQAGVDVLVAGSYIFKGESIKERIESIK